ncbi:SH3 domain-containing protein [Heliobacterium gestii]|uniref:SH3 domain-containing protein n=1 Tax=Heliomicrobium gestii TaxID=2699 RepID=A0A845LJM3_HELGE|nr:SH3 domain-containing protein [Heliomicrobium gestii]MBM7866654.1 hypothetical protein [Heliomicrobium gestii]MZP43066.1 SH3 domain-containing protein [Heliomicrobium gestii]
MDEKGLPKAGQPGLTLEERGVLFSQSASRSRFRFRARLVGGGLALVLSGFVLGQVVMAGASPGTADDPLVSKSYLDKLLGGNRAELHNQIVALNQRVETLQKALEKSGQKVDLPPMPQGFQNTPWDTTDPGGNGAVSSSTDGTPSRSTTAATGNTDGANTPLPAATTPGLREGSITSPSGVNVRFGPGKDYTVITILPFATRVTILASIDGVSDEDKWYKVKMPDGREGFVRQDLVSVK